ncbi:MAG: type II toxin-antitoxin system RelE/ParE family toxin [Bacteroidales bacterium]|nr:type II toxin-antitoxin system RelE/ParE family toxin [Bacteroidales bacterium]MBR6278550.1 type II toxin-antitoxin system RelE/ParE family toxin [Bacteroidales bacterium]
MKLIWDEKAKLSVKEIAVYIRTNFGVKFEKIFRDEIRHITDLLLNNPRMGSLDPLFEGRSKQYRSIIVSGKNKMVYYFDDKTVTIIAFWDSRKEPINQAAQVK